MSRLDELNNNNHATNPASLKITWKSAEKRFASYDLVTKEQALLGNIQFALLTETISIAGFHQEQNVGIFSNEIKNTKTEPLSVRTKNGVLIEGLYNSISEKLQGGKFANNLYVRLRNGELAVIQLSGAALKQYFLYKEANKGKIASNWITITGVKDEKKGAIKYSTPIFTIGEALTQDETDTSELDYMLITNYRKSFQAEPQLELEVPTTVLRNEDDLPF